MTRQHLRRSYPQIWHASNQLRTTSQGMRAPGPANPLIHMYAAAEVAVVYRLRSFFHLNTAWLLPSSATAVILRFLPLPITCFSISILLARLLSFWWRSSRCESSL